MVKYELNLSLSLVPGFWFCWGFVVVLVGFGFCGFFFFLGGKFLGIRPALLVTIKE